MNKSARRIKGLGEVSIRVRDLDAMQKFYEDVVGLEVLSRAESFVFFKTAEGYGGHTHRVSHSLRHPTPCFLITRLNS